MTSSSSSRYVYGIYNASTGSVYIGIKDGIVDTALPDVSAEKYAVYNNATKGCIYFYDGILKGSTKSVYGTVTEIEENTEYSADITTATEVYLVEQSGNQAKIGETEYATLQEAINSASAGDTIQLLKGIPLFVSSEPITIHQGQDIVIDMAGHNMVSALEDVTIQNSGTLTLQNTADTSTTIQAVSSNVIVNNPGATLTVNHITILESVGNSLQNAGSVQLQNTTIEDNVVNTGAMDITDSTMHTIQNANGTVNVHSGTITSITNNTGNVVQHGGTIHNVQNNAGDVSIVAGTVGNITSTGTVTLGTKDGSVATDVPVITGTNSSEHTVGYGIHNNGGQFYFYDGTITGETKAIKGNITEIEENAELLVSSLQTISLQAVDGPAASIGATPYASLQDAIDACEDGTSTTITILRDTVTTGANIPSEKEIIFDINGKVISQYNTLENNGTLQIVDNSGLTTGNITSYEGNGIQNAGTLTMRSGTIADNVTGIVNSGTVTVTGGTIRNNATGISNSGILQISGGVLDSNTTGVNTKGNTTISGGSFSHATYGIHQSGSGTTTITDATFDTNTSGTYTTAGTIVIENATFTGNTYANHVDGGRITIVDATFTNNQHGMYIQTGQGFSGIKDTVVSATPNIVGTVSGIKVNSGAVLHFYDGTIQGTTAAIEGFASYVESGCKVQSTTVDGVYTDRLALSGDVQTVARVDDIEFSSVQAAINSCIGDTAKTVTLLNTVIVTESIKIDSDLKVTLDLNKHNIEGNFNGSIIDNSGELTIIDTSLEKTGKIMNTGGEGIYNTGTLTIGKDDGTIEEAVLIQAETICLQTTGTFKYYDGLLAGNTVMVGNVSSLPSNAVIKMRTENGLTVYYISL